MRSARVVSVVVLVAGLLASSVPSASGAGGTLDPGYGNQGVADITAVSVTSLRAAISRAAATSDGGAFALEGASTANGPALLRRYTAAGTLDPNFDGDGVVELPSSIFGTPGTGFTPTTAIDVATGPGDSAIVIDTRYHAVRIQADGTIDPIFVPTALPAAITTDPATSTGSSGRRLSNSLRVALAPNGEVVIGGNATGCTQLSGTRCVNGGTIGAYVRLGSAGGFVEVAFVGTAISGRNSGYRGHGVLADGRVITATFTPVGNSAQLWTNTTAVTQPINVTGGFEVDGDRGFFATTSSVAQLVLTPSPALVASFGTNGIAGLPVTVNSPLVRQDGSGGVYVVGTETLTSDIVLMHLDATGLPVASFGVGGVARLTVPAGSPTVATMIVSPSSITMYGTARGSQVAALIARTDLNGSLDPTFGQGGIHVGDQRPAPAAELFVPFRSTIASDGTTFSSFTGTTDSLVRLARLTPSGALDPGFGAGGIATVDLSGYTVVAITPDGNGGVYAQVARSNSAAVAHITAGGVLDPSFGTGGIVPVATFAFAWIAVDALGRIVVSAGNDVARLLPNGQLDPAFATNGISTGAALSASLGPDGTIYEWTGSALQIVSAAGVSGATVPLDSSFAAMTAMTDGVVVATRVFAAVETIRLTKYHGDGSLDATFGTAGVVDVPAGQTMSTEDRLQPLPGGGVAVVATGGSGTELTVTAFDAAGNLADFGVSGRVVIPMPSFASSIVAAAVVNGTLQAAVAISAVASSVRIVRLTLASAPPPNPDADGDGIVDAIQSAPGQFSDAIAGHPVTTGSIGSVTPGVTVSVSDAADPLGVHIDVAGASGTAQFTVCGLFTVTVASPSSLDLTCGSVTLGVISGSATVQLADGVSVSVPAGVTAKVDRTPSGAFSITDISGGAVTVVQGSSTTTTTTPTILDVTAPAVEAVVDPATPATGWHRGDATVSWTVGDPDTAITSASCSPTIVTTDTTGRIVSCTATSAGGTTTTSVTIKRDTTAPAVMLTGATNGTLYRAAPTVSCSTTDATSGVATSATLTRTTDLPYVTATCAGAIDVAGNPAAPVSVTYIVAPPVAARASALGTFVPGGATSSAGDTLPGLTAGARATIAFDISSSTRPAATGTLAFAYPNGRVVLAAATWNWFAVDGRTATIAGSATIVGKSGSFPIRLRVRDNPTGSDRVELIVYPVGSPALPSSAPLYQASGDLTGALSVR